MPSRYYVVLVLCVYAQNIQDELAELFPGIKFWKSFNLAKLTGDVLELIIPHQHVEQQGYSIYADRTDCKVKLAFCAYAQVLEQDCYGSYYITVYIRPGHIMLHLLKIMFCSIVH